MARPAKWVVALAAMLTTSAAQSALLGRDIDRHAVDAFDPRAVFLWDDDYNITWLRDANYALTSGFDSDGRMSWYDANGWALYELNVGGLTNWRLPSSLNGVDGTFCIDYECKLSEMGHLYYVELGNTYESGVLNPGPFQNLQAYVYWSYSGEPDTANKALYFDFYSGYQGRFGTTFQTYAMAVRSGDVLIAVPEPRGYALLLAGLGVLGLATGRRKPGQIQRSHD